MRAACTPGPAASSESRSRRTQFPHMRRSGADTVPLVRRRQKRQEGPEGDTIENSNTDLLPKSAGKTRRGIMKIKVLGPLNVEVNGISVVPTAGKPRQILALL